MNKKILNEIEKKEFAKDWTDEEIYEAHIYAAEVACSRAPAILAYKTAEDIAQEELLYGYDKSARNKIGINELKESCTTKHLMNIIHLNCRNNINAFLRKPKNKERALEISIDDTTNNDVNNGDLKFDEIIPNVKLKNDVGEYLLCFNDDIYLDGIDETEDKTITIKYSDGPNKLDGFLSYSKLAKLFTYLFENRKITVKDIALYLYDSNSGKHVDINSRKFRILLKNFKVYMGNVLKGDEVYDLC